MTKKQILISAIIVALYILSFYLTKSFIKVETAQNSTADPFVILPNCAKESIAIGITSDNDTICQSKKGISRYSTEKETMILTATEIVTGTSVISRQNYLLLVSAQKVLVKEILSNLTLLDRGTIELSQTENVIDAFLSTNDSADILLLSTELKAESPADDKSKIRVLSLAKKNANEAFNVLHTIHSKHIDSVLYANFATRKPYFITRTAYPFLELRYKILHMVENQMEAITQCTITEIFPVQNQPLWEQQCSNSTKREIRSIDEQLPNNNAAIDLLRQNNAIMFQDSFLLITADRKLVWKNQEKLTYLLDNVSPTIDTFNIISQQSTRIGKRVYNCIDFGESPQISLRVCIPFYD